MSEKICLKHNEETSSLYTVETGFVDRERLFLLNQLYSPVTMQVFEQYNFSKGASVLELGCGSGDFTCWLAKSVGPYGEVLAIDSDEKQLEVAQSIAKENRIKNIRFKLMKVENIHQLKSKFDFIYARWVLMYVKDIPQTIRAIYDRLNMNGVMICEDVDDVNNCVFSYPATNVLNRWLDYWARNFIKLGLKTRIFDEIYSTYKQLELTQFSVKLNQPTLMNEREKSIISKGMALTRQNILKNKIATKEEFDQFLEDAKEFEKKESIVGFVRNVVVAGRKHKNFIQQQKEEVG